MSDVAFFEDAPVIAMELPDFDTALDRAVNDETDALAFSALTTHLTTARERGDLNQLAQMSMVLGATACMHAHMETVATSSADIMGDSLNLSNNTFDGLKDEHDHNDDEDDDEDDSRPGTRKKRRHAH